MCVSSSSSSTSSGASSSAATSSSSSGGSACTNLIQGSFTVQNSIDIATLASYCGITGDLTIATVGIPSVSLPTITTIGAQLNLKMDAHSQLSLPVLTTVGDRIQGGPIDEFDFPELISAGSVELGGPIKALNVPKLTSVKDLSMSFDPSANISFPSLISVADGKPNSFSGFDINGGASISAPVLSDCKRVSIGGQTNSVDLPAITSLDFLEYCVDKGHCLTSIPTTITMNALTSITDIRLDPPGSPHMSFPNLASIDHCSITVAVGDVSFPKLASIGYGSITVAMGGFSAPNLTSFGETPRVKFSTISADSFSAPKLTTLGGVMTLSSVSSVELGALQNVQSLTVRNTKLTELDLPELTSGNVALTAFGCGFPSNPADCSTNPQLLQFKAPKWTSGQVFFADSTFPKCRANAICAQLGQNPSYGSCWCAVGSTCYQATSPCP